MTDHHASLPAPLSRRRFLSRATTGSLGVAVLPAVGISALRTSRQEPLGPPPSEALDEEYWRLVRAQFALRDGITPMNAANLCPAPRPVIDAVGAAMRDVEADVSFQNRDKYGESLEAVRAGLAAYLGADADEIAIVRNTSEGNNVIVGGLELGRGDEVLLFDENHPTNNVAWDVRAARFGFSVRRIGIDPTGYAPAAVRDAFLDALRPATRVLAFSDVSNTTGLRLPVVELCTAARERGIHTHIDGAQSFGCLTRDLHGLGCDSYATSAHKWFMGPKEAGVLYVRRDRIADVWPGMVGVGWGNGAATSAEGARKFETLGQRNDATLAGLRAALDFHDVIGPARIETRVLELAAALRSVLSALPGASPVTPDSPLSSAGVVVVRFDGIDNAAVYRRLYEQHGIAGAPTGGLRLCPHVYNTLADVQRAGDAVAETLRAVR
jgi:selenocysteine lyase/cysteine desulfurase